MDKKKIKYKIANMCMIEDKKGNVLVQDRVKSWKGLTFPGGKVEIEESITESVKREIYEETNLILNKIDFCGIKDWYDPKENLKYIIFLFKSDDFSGKLLDETYEGKNYWIAKEKLKKSELSPGFDKDLELFFDNGKFEIFWDIIDSEWIRKIY